jgi:alpha-tubulin suppressor-like RCC1 family protein
VCAEVDGGLKCEGDTAEMPALTVKDLVDLQGGIYHTCALDDAGATWCWGDNRDGVVFKERLVIRRTPQPIVGLR